MNKQPQLYPLKFRPILKSTIWGGQEIYKFKGIESHIEYIGENWEVSTIPDNISIVANGELEGRSLSDLIHEYKDRLLGQKNLNSFGTNFPLLIKFIDAKEPLSIQVHPNDKLAKERYGSCGKTEMWYVVQADSDAYIYSGFNRKMTPELYKESLYNKTFVDYLRKYQVKQGDLFFLPAGEVHAIGPGCFILEIQQASDITYRIYDYNRKDKEGNLRELNTDLAKNAINYNVYDNTKRSYSLEETICQPLIHCSYFTTNLIALKQGDTFQVANHDSFHIYICIAGSVKIIDNNNYLVELKQGETVLIPAENNPAIITTEEKATLLEVYIE